MKKNKIKYVLILILASGMLYSGGCSKDSTSKSKDEGMVEHLTAQTFKEKVFDFEKNRDWKYEGDRPCIVDFYADWCGPCKQVAPILEDISREYAGKIAVYKVNVDSEQQLASAFGIQSIPSILFIPKDGQPQMTMGAMPKENFVKAINEILLK
jgi:thioredoxin